MRHEKIVSKSVLEANNEMKEKILVEMIKDLEINSSIEDAYIEYAYDDAYEKYLMKANKDGLKLFAKELLQIASNFDNYKNNKAEFQPIKLENEDWFFDQEAMPTFVEPIFLSRKDIKVIEPQKSSWKDDLIGFVIVIILGVIIISAIIGFYTFVSWI